MAAVRAVAIGGIAGAVMGAMLWLIALVGAANYAEEACFEDLAANPGYRTYHGSAGLWPPHFECRLRSSDAADLVVEHDAVAFGALGAVVLLPVAYGTSAAAALTIALIRTCGRSPASDET